MATQPITLRIRMYNVGFGDSFLLTFEYGKPPVANDRRKERHLLLDFGSNRYAPGGPSLRAIAELIRDHCSGQLDVLVVSHRHKDHVRGFDPADGGDVIASLKPKLVIRPWTEHPLLKDSDRKPYPGAGFTVAVDDAELATSAAAIGDPNIGQKSLEYAAGLEGRENQAAAVAASLVRAGISETAQGPLSDFVSLAFGVLKNSKAVANLDEIADGEGEYVYYGKESGITDAIIPGVKAKVLGPATPDQYPPIAHQAAERDDYWFALTQQLGINGLADRMMKNSNSSERPPNVKPVGPQRWIVDRLLAQPSSTALELVRWLDKEMNNTSVILLLTVRGKRLLFPGDAQGESWDWVLRQAPEAATNRDSLAKVDLYKVGHHGSRNATPSELMNLWSTPKTINRPILGLMSTLLGVYPGTKEDGVVTNEVPRGPLVDALKKRMDEPNGGGLLRTMDSHEQYVEVECDLTRNGSTFRRVNH